VRTAPLIGLGLLLLVGAPLAAPRPAFLYAAPVEVAKGAPLIVEGNLVGGPFARLVVKARAPGAAWEEFELSLQYGDLYRATLPAALVVPPALELYVEGTTDSGPATALFATAARPARVLVLGEGTPEQPEQEALVKDELLLDGRTKKPRCKRGRRCAEEPGEERTQDGATGEAPPAVAELPLEPPRGAERAPKPGGPSSEVPPPLARRAEGGAAPVRTRLEDELAVYAAEASAARPQRLEQRATTSAWQPMVLTAEELKSLGVRHVHEALDLVPGLSVSRDVQGFYRLAVRGLRSDAEVAFFLDGQRLNHFYDGRALWSLPVDNLARIEVIRGPSSVDTGPGDFLAVVRLFSAEAKGLRASASGGSFDAFDGHVAGGATLGAVTVGADVDVARQYGYRRAVTRDGLDPPGATPRAKQSLDNRFLVNAGVRASLSTGAGTFGLHGRFLLEDRSALIGLFDVVGNDSRLGWRSIDTALTWSRAVGAAGTLSARLSFDQQDTRRLWQLAPRGYQASAANPDTLFPDGIREQVTVGARTIALAAKAELSLPARNRLVAGLDGQLQSLSDFSALVNYVPGSNVNAGDLTRPAGLTWPTESGQRSRGPAADRLAFGLYGADTWTPIDALAIEIGLRVDVTQLPTTSASGAWLGTALTPAVGPRLGLSVTPLDALVFRGHYARAWRAPTVQELAEALPNSDSNQGRAVGNPALGGAYVDVVEGGAEFVQGIGDARLRLRANAFFERLSNPIALIDGTGNLVPYTNRPLGVQSFGLEGEARLEVSPRCVAWANASWQRAEDLGTPATGRLLTDVPQVRLNAGFSLPLGPWLNVDVVARSASERRNNSRSVLEQIRRYTLPAYTLVSAQLRTEPIFEHLELLVTGQNVFTVDFADDVPRPDRIPGGVPRESLLVFGTARVTF
jgi:outer membrane receptor protein involved in Fe transport